MKYNRISVIQTVHQDVTGEYYNSGSISGTPDETNSSAIINDDWGHGKITQTHCDVAARFTGTLIVFQTGTRNLYLVHDDGGKLWINGNDLIIDSNTWGTDNATYDFKAFQNYQFKLDWSDTGSAGHIKLKWETGYGIQLIPSDNYGISNEIGASPLRIYNLEPNFRIKFLKCLGLKFENASCRRIK